MATILNNLSNKYTCSEDHFDGKTITITQKAVEVYDVSHIEGEAVVTMIGGNGFVKFIHDATEYMCRPNNAWMNTPVVAWTVNEVGDKLYVGIDSIRFTNYKAENWSKLYIYHEDKTSYWKVYTQEIAAA